MIHTNCSYIYYYHSSYLNRNNSSYLNRNNGKKLQFVPICLYNSICQFVLKYEVYYLIHLDHKLYVHLSWLPIKYSVNSYFNYIKIIKQFFSSRK